MTTRNNNDTPKRYFASLKETINAAEWVKRNWDRIVEECPTYQRACDQMHAEGLVSAGFGASHLSRIVAAGDKEWPNSGGRRASARTLESRVAELERTVARICGDLGIVDQQ